MLRQRTDAPSRSVTDIGPGDYVKIGSTWRQVESNSAHSAERTPRNWTICSEIGTHDMWAINSYAKAEDLTDE